MGNGRTFHRLPAWQLLYLSQLRVEGLKVDRDTANAGVGTWLPEIANARVHRTTGEVPPVSLELEPSVGNRCPRRGQE